MNWNGNRAMVLTREFERNNPFEEIFPPRVTDALGNDALQNTLQMCAGNFEGRYDRTEPLQSLLQKLYDLRQCSEAEEWPMPAEPITEEVQP